MAKVNFVATPIGNLGDMTYRAVETLKNSDIIFCEDTRHSLTLLNKYEIRKPLKSFHKFNEVKTLDFICECVKGGQEVSIISDAGMPCVSDPGYLLVRRLIEENVEYTVLPGACAFVTALVLSGFTAPFTFVGFLNEKLSDKQRQLSGVSNSNVLIFYSAVHNINDDLKFLKETLGNRKVAVVKEISKMFENVTFFDLNDAIVSDPRGEFVIVVDKIEEENTLNTLSIERHVEFYVKGGMTKMEAIKQTAKDRNMTKNDIYKLFID